MSILNVNQIQPVGSGQTVTISATNIDTGSATFTGSSATFNNGLNVTGGSVGIGTTNPSGKLDVDSTIDTYLNVTTSNNGSGAGIVLISNNNNEFVGYANSLRFGTVTGKNAAGFSEKLRITSGGNVQIANGNLVFSTSGTGIDFSANSNAAGMTSELLDDYEEGTYTPVLSGGGYTYTSGSYTAGRYTKVGRIVTVEAHYNINAISGSSDGSSTRITLPFAPSNLYSGGRWCQVLCRLAYFNASAIQRVYCAQLTTNSSSADIVYYYTSSAVGTDQPVNIGADYQSASNNGQIAFVMTYVTAS